MISTIILAVLGIYEQIINEKTTPTTITTPPITLGAGKLTLVWTPNA